MRVLDETRASAQSRLGTKINADYNESIRNQSHEKRVAASLRELNDYIKSNLNLRAVTNFTFIFVVSVVCLQQCYIQFQEYSRYSTRIQVSHVLPKNSIDLLPGITLCSNNRFMMSKLVEREPALRVKLDSALNNLTREDIALLPKARRAELLKSIKEVVESTLDVGKSLVESSMDKRMNLSINDMIQDVNCNSIWGKDINCKAFRIVESYLLAPCYTLFYLGAQIEAFQNNQVSNFSHSVIGQRNLQVVAFGDHEIVDILIDFEPFDYADFERDVGGKLIIHSTAHVGSPLDSTHLISPGHSYDVIVERTVSRRLPPPYKSQCRDYIKLNSDAFRRQNDTPATVELDRTSCFRNCMARLTIEQCNCWPVEVPYSGNVVNGSGEISYCLWGSNLLHRTNSSMVQKQCYKNNRNACVVRCPASCITEEYKTRVISLPWPSKDHFVRAKSKQEKQHLKRLQECCAKVSLKYHEFMETRLTMYPSMTFSQLISNIGGIVSGLIGVSTLTIYRYVTRDMLRLKIINNKQPKDASRNIQDQND